MSQEGANLPQEVERSHDHTTSPHGSIPAGATSMTEMPAGSNSCSTINMSEVNNPRSERISLAVVPATEDNNSPSKIANQAVPHARDGNNSTSKIHIPVVLHLHAGQEHHSTTGSKLASTDMLLAGEVKGGGAKSNLTTPVMLRGCNNNKDRSKLAIEMVHHVGMDNTARSMLASTAVLQVSDINDGSQIASSAVLQSTMDNTNRSKLDSPVVVHAGEDKDKKLGLKFASSMVLHAGKDKKAGSKFPIQAVPHVGGDTGSKLTNPPVLRAREENNIGSSRLAIQAVPYASEDNNNVVWPREVDSGKRNAQEGNKNVAGQAGSGFHAAANTGYSALANAGRNLTKSLTSVGGGVYEAVRGSSSSRKGTGTRKGAAKNDVDHELHIFTERERRKKMKNMFSTLHSFLPQLPSKADKATIVGETVSYIETLEGTLRKLEMLKLERTRALAVSQQQGAGGSGMVCTSSTQHPAPVSSLVGPTRETNLADVVHGWQAQQAVVVAAAKAAAAAAADGVGSSSTTAADATRLPTLLSAPVAGFHTWFGLNIVVSVANNEAYINLCTPPQQGTLTKALFVLERHHIDVVTTTISTQQDGKRMYNIHARINSTSSRYPENLSAEDRFKLAVSEMLQLVNN